MVGVTGSIPVAPTIFIAAIFIVAARGANR
jgi:hypothetical protein